MNREPDFLHNLRQEIANGRHWLDRAVVIGFAVLAGLAVVGFTLLADAAFELFEALRGAAGWAPQVMAALAPEVPAAERSRFVSLKHSAAKVLGVSGGLLAGLSIGRQGPSVQVAAGVMHLARRYLSPKTAISERELLMAGGLPASRRLSTRRWAASCLPSRNSAAGWSSAAAA